MTTATPRATAGKKRICILSLNFAIIWNCSVSPAQTNDITPAIDSRSKYEKLAAVVQVLQKTQNLVISRITHVPSHCFAHYTFCLVMFPLPSWFVLAPYQGPSANHHDDDDDNENVTKQKV